MICPRCSVAEIVPSTGACSLCGYVPEGNVAVEAPHPDATDQLARHELAHEFRIDVLLGQGDHSAVYLAREGRSSAYMVVKVLPRPQDRDPQADERFRRAVELLITLDHPHIVPVHRFGTTDSLFWYTMDHVRARSLREILRSRGRIELKMCQRIVAQVASALDYAHRRGVVHGAMKPENVLMDPNGWVHVCDPMVTRAIERPAAPPRRPSAAEADGADAANGETVGSAPARRRPDYIAPEDWAGLQRNAGSDQYALAVLVHECLAGAPPSAGADAFEPPATLEALRPDLPPHVTHAVRRAMSPKPADRYPSVLDFVMALESGVLPLTDARPSGRSSDLILTIPDWEPPPSDRPKFLIPLLAVVGLAALGAVLWSPVQRWRQDRDWSSQMADRVIPATVRPETVRTVADSSATAPVSAPQPPATRPRSAFAPPPEAAPESRPRATRNPPAPAAQRPGSAAPVASAPATSAPAPTPAPAPASAPAPAGEPGRLFVNASPWGQVFVDGTSVGNTPKANLQVQAGTHTVRVVREGYEPWERTIQVAPGEVVRLTGIALTARP